jgi:intein/homing endonuclease
VAKGEECMNKDFERAFKSISDEYGEDFEILNGLHESQLNFSDFIDAFVDKNVADVTIDSNANASHKDIRSLMSEKGKSNDKLIAFNKIFYEIKKKYGLKTAKEWLETEYNGGFYLHDAPSTTYYAYSYKGSETIVVKYKGIRHLLSFEMLYDLVQEKPQLLSKKDNAYCKYTNDLYVWDKDNKWSKVIRVIKKPKTNDFHFIKSSNGMSEIVTSNHPVITVNGDKDAKDITNSDKIISEEYSEHFGDITYLYVAEELFDNGVPLYLKGEVLTNKTDARQEGQICYFKSQNPIQNKIYLDFDFGWLIGLFIAEGNFMQDSMVISQNKGKIFNNLINILEKLNFGYSISQKNTGKCYAIRIRSRVLCDLIQSCFCKKDKSYNKKLNSEILKYNKEFIKGVIGGILDGDGSLTQAQGRRIHIRTTSRTLMNQLAFMIRMFGYTVREQSPTFSNTPRMYEGRIINQKHYIYHIAFTPYNDVENFNSIKIQEHCVEYTSKKLEGRYTNGKYTFGYGENNVTNNIILYRDRDEYVYDISVETGHFMCNNILSHNCYAYDLTRLATEGLFFLKNYNNKPPKHLTTFIDDVIEYISYMSNRSSGAVGIPNVLIWTYYFWKKDCESNYIIKNKDYYIRQCFQKLIYRLNQPFMRIDQ